MELVKFKTRYKWDSWYTLTSQYIFIPEKPKKFPCILILSVHCAKAHLQLNKADVLFVYLDENGNWNLEEKLGIIS